MFKSNFEIEQHLALFLTIFYVKPWIKCPLPFEATNNDIGFFHQLRSVQGKSNLPPFCDGFLTAALNSSGLRNVQSVQMHRGPPTSGGPPHLTYRAQKNLIMKNYSKL